MLKKFWQNKKTNLSLQPKSNNYEKQQETIRCMDGISYFS